MTQSLRSLILEVLLHPSLQNNVIFYDLASKQKITIRRLKTILTNFISAYFDLSTEDDDNDGGSTSTCKNSCWKKVIALEIDDAFPLAIAEISCVLAGLPFLPLDSSDPYSYRSKQYELCGVWKVITQQQVYDSLSSSSVTYESENSISDTDEKFHKLVNNVYEKFDDEQAKSSAESHDESNQNFSDKKSPLYLIFTSGSSLQQVSQSTTTNSLVLLPKCLVVDDVHLLTYLGNISKSKFFDLTTTRNQNEKQKINSLCLSSATFDPSIGDIFTPFFHLGNFSGFFYSDDNDGSAAKNSFISSSLLVCATKSQILNDVTRCITESRKDGFPITHIITSPALWKNVVQVDENLITCHRRVDKEGKQEQSTTTTTNTTSLLHVALGGEMFPSSLLLRNNNTKSTTSDNIRYFSIYGLTEATVYQTLREMKDLSSDHQSNKCLLGSPLSDEIELFVSPSSSSSSDFTEGELVIRSKQVVRGILLPATSSSTQKCTPFKNKQLFTGDIVRVPKANLISINNDNDDVIRNQEDEKARNLLKIKNNNSSTQAQETNNNTATIELLGRADFQVKLSGRRVNLEDVERTVESCVGFCSVGRVEKCICVVNPSKTGIIAVVKLMTNKMKDSFLISRGKNQSLPKVIRFIANLSLRERERISEVVIWDGDGDGDDNFPITKNGKTDRKKISEKIFLSRKMIPTDDDECANNNDDNADATSSSQKRHPVKIALENLVKEIWSEALGVDQSMLSSSNFFTLGGDSLLCVKVSREILYAIFPDEADDRTSTTPKRRKRSGDVAAFVKNFLINKKTDKRSTNEDNDDTNENDDEIKSSSETTSTTTLINLRVDEFGAFKGPVQPRILMKNPALRKYCHVLWSELCEFIGFHENNNNNNDNNINNKSDDESHRQTDQNYGKNNKSNSNNNHHQNTFSQEIQEFADLLHEAIDESDELSVSILLDAESCLNQLSIEPSSQLGLSTTAITKSSPDDDSSSIKQQQQQQQEQKSKPKQSTNNKKNNKNKDRPPRIAFPLHHAVQNNDLKMVKLLTNGGLQQQQSSSSCLFIKPTDFTLSSHVTALHAAAQLQDPAILAYLVEECENGPLQVRDSRFQNLLHYCARSGSEKTTRWLIQKCRRRPPSQEKERSGDNCGSVSSTKAADEKVEVPSSTETTTLRKNHQNNSSLLNTMILARDRWQRAPLHWAIVNGHTEVARCLVEEGEVEYFPSADRKPNQLLRLTSHRTALPYETCLDMAKRLYGEKENNREDSAAPSGDSVHEAERMIEIVAKSKIN